MKKVSRLKLDELANNYEVIPQDMQRVIIAGKLITFDGMGKIMDVDESYGGRENTFVEVLGSSVSDIQKMSGDISYRTNSDGLYMYGSGVGLELFQFLAKYTNVEWGMLRNSSSKDAVLNTSHEKYRCIFDLPKRDEFDEHWHSHPYNAPADHASQPSNDDLETAEKLKKAGVKNFFILHNDTSYTYADTSYTLWQGEPLDYAGYNSSHISYYPSWQGYYTVDELYDFFINNPQYFDIYYDVDKIWDFIYNNNNAFEYDNSGIYWA